MPVDFLLLITMRTTSLFLLALGCLFVAAALDENDIVPEADFVEPKVNSIACADLAYGHSGYVGECRGGACDPFRSCDAGPGR